MSDVKNILLEDKINTKDSKEEVLASKIRRKRGPVFYTEIDCYNELGEKLFSEHNEMVLPGAIFLAEKLCNVDAPIKAKTINTDLGVAVTESNPGFAGRRREAAICLFGVGTGGSGNNFNTVIPVDFNERTLKGFIPIRRVETGKDLSTAEKAKYCMKKTNNGYYEYYLKKFEIEPTIKVEYDEPGNPSVPPNFDEASSSKVINTYMQFNIKVSKYDVREYFKTVGGGISNARVNTLGLFIGYPETTGGVTEYKGVQLFSKLNFNNEPLDNESKELNIIYKIYIA